MNIKPIFLFLLIVQSNISYSKIWYVNINATGSKNGNTWSNAYTDLQAALSSSTSGDTIWVAAGTYKPTTGTSRTVYFNLKSGVNVYGGFAGNETSLSKRDIKNNLTILSGDIGNLGDPADNSNHVLMASNLGTALKIDGFRITGGKNGPGSEGGGIYIDNCKITISNCHFVSNSTGFAGALYQEYGTVIVEDCIFNDNVATSHVGAAIYGKISGSFYMTRCEFYSNKVDKGAAYGIAYFSGLQDVYITNCIFANNDTKSKGVITVGGGNNFTLKNCLIIGNYGYEGEPISISNGSSSVNNIINCTIAHNYADSNYIKTNAAVVHFANTAKARNILNCIIYDNAGSADVMDGCTVSNCILERGYSKGTYISTKSPQFVKPGKLLDAPFALTGLDYTLQLSSPAIDFGNKTYLINSDSLDLKAKQRIAGSNVDAGAYESQNCDLKVAIKFNGSKEICSGNSIDLTADNGNSWLWNTGSKLKSIKVSASGTYTVVALDTITGCRGTAIDSIKVYTASVKITGTNQFCDGASSVITATGSNTRYLWNTSDTVKAISVVKKGLYMVRATSDKGCFSYDSLFVTVDTLPIPKISVTESSGLKNNDTIICSGSTINLLASGGLKYTWSDSTKTAQLNLSPASNLNMAVKVSNSFGCSIWSQPILVKVNSLPKPSINVKDNSGTTNDDGIICAGDTTYLESATFNSYLWSSGSMLKTIKVIPITNTTYNLSVTDFNGCMGNTSKNIVSNSLPNPVIQKVGNNLQTGNFASYQWFLNDTILPGAISNVFTPKRIGKYKVIVTNTNACNGMSNLFDLTSMSIENLDREKIEIFPNPANKEFVINNLNIEYEIRIYNSVGKLLINQLVDSKSNTINIENLDSGFYYVALITKTGSQFKSSKLIINKF